MSETWKHVKGWEGYYSVSNLGRIRSEARIVAHKLKGKKTIPEMIMKQSKSMDYFSVRLTRDCKSKFIRVHRLIAEAFIPNPENKPQVNHKNRNRLDNRIENLEWCTHRYNIQHAYIGKHKNKKEICQFTKDGKFMESFESIAVASRKTGILNTSISNVLSTKTKTSGGFIWKYKERR